jgi:hypothetical protein
VQRHCIRWPIKEVRNYCDSVIQSVHHSRKSLLKKLIFLYKLMSVLGVLLILAVGWIDVLWDHNDDDFHSVFNTLGVVSFHCFIY